MAAKRDIQVLIGGKIYTLSGYESEEYLQKIALYINNKMDEMDQIPNYRRLSMDMQKTLLELNMADDYHKAKKQIEMLEADIEEKDKTEHLLNNTLDISQKISEDIENADAEKIIDAQDKILMPGLVNTHTHISMSLFRGLADDLALDSWLNDHIWPMEAHLTKEYTYIGALLGAIEMIKSGTTTFSDMYFYMDGVAQAVEESGIRSVLSYGMIDFGDAERRENEIKERFSFKPLKTVIISCVHVIKRASGV